MTLSLYAATVPTYLQMLGSTSGLVDKAESWCAEKGMSPAELLGRRLAPDMEPLSYQIKSVVVHSATAIEAVRAGVFAPDHSKLATSFAPLRERVAAAVETLREIEPAEMDGWVGRDMSFAFGKHRIAFTADNFLLSFSQPNFFFHVTTAYAILRAEGLAIGKGDFLGRYRRKPKA